MKQQHIKCTEGKVHALAIILLYYLLSCGCIQSVDWINGLDYWTDRFHLKHTGMLFNGT